MPANPRAPQNWPGDDVYPSDATFPAGVIPVFFDQGPGPQPQPEFHFIVERPGMSSLRLTPNVDTLRYATLAVGGFGSCSFTVPGKPSRWKRELPHLAKLTVTYGDQIIYEGQIEDVGIRVGQDASAQVTCFGFQRRLDEVTVRRVWSSRGFQWRNVAGGGGADLRNGVLKSRIEAAYGQIDITDLTKVGVLMAGDNANVVEAGYGQAMEIVVLPNATLQRFMANFVLSGANTGPGKLVSKVAWSNDGSTWGTQTLTASDSGLSVALSGFGGNDVNRMRLYFYNSAGFAGTPLATDLCQFLSIRLLGTSLTEDTSGGFYGGTLLRDLVGLVPDLTVGTIETGDDFTVQALERAVRTAARSVVEEITGYYSREWAVWEGGRFDWKTVNLDEPQWVIPLANLSELEITASVDGLTRTSYLVYTDAALDGQSEQSGASTDQRNPYVKQGKTKDVIGQPGFPMTSLSASQLAGKLASDSGAWPPVRGKVTLPARRLVRHVALGEREALTIRAGSNLLVPDLPKSDLLAPGRDGETLFHIVSTDVDMRAQTVSLELEGQTRKADVLLARLAAVTRTVTG